MAAAVEEMKETTLFKTFTNFHQLILWEIASNLPLATIQNLLIALKGNQHITDTLMPIINSYMNRYITRFNIHGSRYCLSKSSINRPLEKKEEIDFVRAQLVHSYNERWDAHTEILCMLNYLEHTPSSKEEQMQISHILLSFYWVAIYPNTYSEALPQFTFKKRVK